MAASGIGTSRIAKALKSEGILNPTAYCIQVLGINRPFTYKTDTDWSKTSIAEIIRNRVYLGHMVSQKASTISFKNKTRVRFDEEDHVTVPDTHEALVDQDTFDLAQKVFSIKNRGNKYGFENIFVGVLKCSDCGSGLSIAFPTSKKTYFSYSCNRYRQYSTYCTSHYIRYDDIYRIVLESIQEKQRFVKAHEDDLALYAQKLADRGADIELQQIRTNLEKFRKRRNELDILIQKLFEQVALGTIEQERFASLSQTYEQEQKILKEKINNLQAKEIDRGGRMQEILRFFELVRKHDNVTELTAEILHELIDNVVIYQAEGKRKDRSQKVVINFRFIKDNWFIF